MLFLGTFNLWWVLRRWDHLWALQRVPCKIWLQKWRTQRSRNHVFQWRARCYSLFNECLRGTRRNLITTWSNGTLFIRLVLFHHHNLRSVCARRTILTRYHHWMCSWCNLWGHCPRNLRNREWKRVQLCYCSTLACRRSHVVIILSFDLLPCCSHAWDDISCQYFRTHDYSCDGWKSCSESFYPIAIRQSYND